MNTSLPIGTVALFLILGSIDAFADDWPQWRGPQRDGISQETGLLKEWPADGPKLVWKVTDIGAGYSTPSVVSGRLYLLANEGLKDEFAQALDAYLLAHKNPRFVRE
jgi:outer membrane protein assembly factor BamB